MRVAFVPLSAIREPDLVLPTVAQALGVREGGDRPLAETLTATLYGRSLLLVLDNFEQVLGAAPLVTELLGSRPRLTALVTIRVVLRVSGEHVVRVPPLALPDPADPTAVVGRAAAVRLFAERARAAEADFALDEETAGAVAAVCARLDGQPLAIELAAARVSVLSPRAMLARLETRLPLLTGGPRDHPARLRTMRDAIAWSHDLLTPDEQVLFRRLAVFAGGFTLQAAAAVAGDGDGPGGAIVLDDVVSLVDKSLVQRTSGADAEPRFAMLETVREFALERLAASGEADEVASRHAAWCLKLAEGVRRGVPVPQPGSWQDRLAAEVGNVRAALGWALARGEPALGLRLTDALTWYWLGGGHVGEGRRWQERFLAAGGDVPPAVRARGLCLAGDLARAAGDDAAAVPLFEASLALARRSGDGGAIADALWSLGAVAADRGDLDRQVARFAEALALYRAADDAHGTAWMLQGLGLAARKRGELGQARALHEEALAAFHEGGNAVEIAWATAGLGEVTAAEANVAEAATHFREGLELHAAQGGPCRAGRDGHRSLDRSDRRRRPRDRCGRGSLRARDGDRQHRRRSVHPPRHRADRASDRAGHPGGRGGRTELPDRPGLRSGRRALRRVPGARGDPRHRDHCSAGPRGPDRRRRRGDARGCAAVPRATVGVTISCLDPAAVPVDRAEEAPTEPVRTGAGARRG